MRLGRRDPQAQLSYIKVLLKETGTQSVEAWLAQLVRELSRTQQGELIGGAAATPEAFSQVMQGHILRTQATLAAGKLDVSLHNVAAMGELVAPLCGKSITVWTQQTRDGGLTAKFSCDLDASPR